MHSLACDPQNLREFVVSKLLLDAALHPRLLGVALFNQADQQHVVFGVLCVSLLKSLLA